MSDAKDQENIEILKSLIGARISNFETSGDGFQATLILDDGRRIQLGGFDDGLTLTSDRIEALTK